MSSTDMFFCLIILVGFQKSVRISLVRRMVFFDFVLHFLENINLAGQEDLQGLSNILVAFNQ